MAGISSKSANSLINKYKYNGIELNEDMGVNVDEAFFRELDHELGQWWQIDPKVESNMENWSPYVSNFDNPIRFNDPKGDCPTCDDILKEIKSAVTETAKAVKENAVTAYIGLGNVARAINQVNPLASLVEVITGKSTSSDFTEAKPRLMAAADLGVNTLLLFGGEIRAASATTKIGTGSTKVGISEAEANGAKASAVETENTVKSGTKEVVEKVSKNFNKISDFILEKNGIDAHQLKRDFLGEKAKISLYDLYKDKNTNEIVILLKGGKGDPIQTGEFLK